jgi:hypothetical protein
MAKKQKKLPKVSNQVYEAEIFRLPTELVSFRSGPVKPELEFW